MLMEMRAGKQKRKPEGFLFQLGAGEESRTLDLYLGKVSLYQLSYSRMGTDIYCNRKPKPPALKLEREKSLELSTYTLARYRSTN